MNCSRIDVEVYGEETSKDAVGIVSNGLRHFLPENLDVILIDTAGRHKDELGFFEEMKSMHSVSKPDLVLLVIDGTIGQQAYNQSKVTS